MIKIGPSLPQGSPAEQNHRTPPTPANVKPAVKAGTVIILTPNALKLSRELQAITADPAKDPAARLEASEKLRQLASSIFNGN